MPWVRLKPEVEHRAGTVKDKQTIRVTKNELRDFNDKFVTGVENPGAEGTEAALELYRENRDVLPALEDIAGSGELGIVLKGDVERLLNLPEGQRWW